MNSDGFRWIPMDSGGIPGIPVDSGGIRRNSRIPADSGGICGGIKSIVVFLDVKNKRKFEYVDSRSVVDDLVSICGAHNLLDLVVWTSSVSWNEMTTNVLPSCMNELGRVHISTWEENMSGETLPQCRGMRWQLREGRKWKWRYIRSVRLHVMREYWCMTSLDRTHPTFLDCGTRD